MILTRNDPSLLYLPLSISSLKLYQAILKPDLAKNLVTFLLFGIMPGSIALEGTFKKVGKKTVKVIFNRPKFTLLGQTVSD